MFGQISKVHICASYFDHNILLKKLDYYGVTGIANEWFASYLKNRKQFVFQSVDISQVVR